MTQYIPGPWSGLPDDLGRYVVAELNKIAESFLDAQGGGSILSEGMAQITATTTPQLLSEWDFVTPSYNPQNVIGELSEGAVYLKRAGIWRADFEVVASVQNNRHYEIRLFADDTPTQFYAQVDPSNQTDVVTITGYGVERVFDRRAGALKLDLRVSTVSGTGPFTVVRAALLAQLAGN